MVWMIGLVRMVGARDVVWMIGVVRMVGVCGGVVVWVGVWVEWMVGVCEGCVCGGVGAMRRMRMRRRIALKYLSSDDGASCAPPGQPASAPGARVWRAWQAWRKGAWLGRRWERGLLHTVGIVGGASFNTEQGLESRA